jgi:PAS domain-containing protein
VPLTVVDRVRGTRRPVAVEGPALGDLPRDRYLLRHRPRALLCLPLLHGDRLVGVVYLEHHQAPPGPAGQLDTLRILAAHAAVALDDAANRTRLYEAGQLLEAAFGVLPVGLVLLDPDFHVRRASPYASQLAGLLIRPGTPVAELFDMLSPADRQQPPYALELALAVAGEAGNATLHREISVVQRQGAPVRLATSATALRHPDGSLLGVALVLAPAAR